ncbi:MAG: hypothetical protein LBQ12_09145 [Deltaproteobacteria bacterium]|jgi:hypothetical protein|nr:hypothetical protein [Deltaproteobacteria bacterium]
MKYADMLLDIAWVVLAISVVLIAVRWMLAVRLRKGRKEAARELSLLGSPAPEPSNNP